MTREFRMTGAFRIVSAISAVLMAAAGVYLAMFGKNILQQGSGAALVLFGIAGFVDALVSRIILEDDEIRIVSLARRRSYDRGEFESAKVDGGQVCLKRRDGGWLKLPGTGANALAVRNTIDAWIKKQRGQESNS